MSKCQLPEAHNLTCIVERLDKLERHYYSDGDLSAIHGQLENIHKNSDFEFHRMKRLEDRLVELEIELSLLKASRIEDIHRITEVERFQNITHHQYQFNIKNKDEVERIIKIKDDVYAERNKCIAALANFIRDIAHPGFRVYVAYHDGGDWEDDWRTILVIERGELQMTWHFHDSEKHLLSRLKTLNVYKWDGHDTEEKYKRLLKCFMGE